MSRPLSTSASAYSPVILKSVAEVRAWRQKCRDNGEDVGMVPTMGALHDGHLSLARASLEANHATLMSIFVNPAQFAPHEDLATYPRTFEADLALLSSLSVPSPISNEPTRSVSAVFLPPVEALYPSGITTDVSKQRGTFIEVKGLQEVMEGASRPGFFRGVATVVTKLFNIVEPTRAYFGQKDIQQALLLRRMLEDLHVSHPLPSNLVILPTHRDPHSGLALSSRNAYLSTDERRFATVVIDALRASEAVWNAQGEKVNVKDVLEAARSHVEDVRGKAEKEGVAVELKYFALNDPHELFDLEGAEKVEKSRGAVLSGAVMLGKTRLIDNMVFQYALN
ncbi:pantoate-beta-alanine ligase [Pseudohyphozyma bogoriensis]|nr:pantoate-beta-alanine ligase [Pseudohyphozyma bogoriensis]